MPTRKTFSTVILILSVALAGGTQLMALEKPSYEIVETDGDIELRRYAPYVVVETRADGDYDRATSEAFRRLFRYISGANRRQVDPQAPKIAMTAPVTTAREGDGWRMAFMVPDKYDLETAPAPANPAVTLRAEPGGLLAALTYGGRSSRERYHEHLRQLDSWLAERGLEAAGEPMFAGYDAPYVPGFMRRNEVLMPLADNAPGASPAPQGLGGGGR